MTTNLLDPKMPSGWVELLSGRNAIYSLALSGGVALHAVNIYIVTTVMPSVVIDIGGLDYYAWSTTLFVVASILGSALSVRLLRKTGSRGAYAAAAVLFAVGTAICSVAPSMPVLLAGRVVQGLGGGFLYALAYSVIREVFPQSLWSRAIGLISAMWGVSTLVGPAVGGAFAELGAWRAAFWSLIPMIGMFGLLAWFVLPGRRTGNIGGSSALPSRQLILLCGAVLSVSAGSTSTSLSFNITGLLVAGIFIGLLFRVERTADVRLLPTDALGACSPLGALYASVAFLVISMQPDVFVPYFLQVLHSQSPLTAGYLAALMAMGWTAASMISSGAAQKTASRLLVIGPLAVLAGLLVLCVTLPWHSGGQLMVLAPISLGLVLVGFGIGLAWPHLVTRVFSNAPTSERDLAAGGVTTVQLSATALGVAIAGMVANLGGLTDPGGVAGASSAATALFLSFALAPLIALFVVRRVLRQAALAI
ncbi:MAG: MFS transporter [Pseudorhizobium sp.]